MANNSLTPVSISHETGKNASCPAARKEAPMELKLKTQAAPEGGGGGGTTKVPGSVETAEAGAAVPGGEGEMKTVKVPGSVDLSEDPRS
jgi:hypothetical protein